VAHEDEIRDLQRRLGKSDRVEGEISTSILKTHFIDEPASSKRHNPYSQTLIGEVIIARRRRRHGGT
jgi:hypothetical protein